MIEFRALYKGPNFAMFLQSHTGHMQLSQDSSVKFRWQYLIAATMLFVYSSAIVAIASEHPNVILILTDDQGYGPLGRHGNSWIKTPSLDQLYDQSVRFDRFLVSPTCAPTRSALMTGRHPMKNGITHTILERERMALSAITLPQILHTSGYKSGIYGKWHLGDEDEYQPQNRGFDEAFIHGGGGIGQAYDCSCADVPDNGYFNPIIRHNGTFVQTSGFCTDVFFDSATRWIEDQIIAEQPYFAYIATNAPHAPYFAPAANIERFKKLGFEDKAAGFYGMIENIDENVGRLITRLENLKQMENTLLVFMSDNGMAHEGIKGQTSLGTTEDGMPLFGWNANMRGLKNSPDEGGVRVPCFFRWDGHLKPNKSIDTVVAHIDFLPTVAEICHASIADIGQVEGHSLTGLMPWSNAEFPSVVDSIVGERYLFTHIGRWPTHTNVDQHKFKGYAVRNQRYRLVDGKLFDMLQDPYQTLDIGPKEPKVLAKMNSAFDDFWSAAKPLMVNEFAEMSPTKPFWEAFHQQKSTVGISQWP